MAGASGAGAGPGVMAAAGGLARDRGAGRPEGFGEGDACLQAAVSGDGFGGFSDFDPVGVAQGGGQRGVGVKGVVLASSVSVMSTNSVGVKPAVQVRS